MLWDYVLYTLIENPKLQLWEESAMTINYTRPATQNDCVHAHRHQLGPVQFTFSELEGITKYGYNALHLDEFYGNGD